MDLTYSGIGGGEVANVPRSILTLAPTKTKGLHCLHVSKRKTTGWKDPDGRYTDRYLIKRTDNPSRPAWLPVTPHEAETLISEGQATKGNTKSRKVGPHHVVQAVTTGDMQRKALLEQLARDHHCGLRSVEAAYSEAKALELIDTYSEKNPRGGKNLTWVCLPDRKPQEVI
ncbi:hypothetical protein [Luteolibacter soli]|uniref:Uncharacterized protein n=1 Tax=Luteolibacter soli TaxID=3135280 RepID=A0ABU9AXW4_9BACT